MGRIFFFTLNFAYVSVVFEGFPWGDGYNGVITVVYFLCIFVILEGFMHWVSIHRIPQFFARLL